MFCVQLDYVCNHKTFQRSIITSWPHPNQIWWSRSSRSSPLIRYVMCFSLILLSVDLSSPHVKNKMSKREFIRNTRGAVGAEGDKTSFVGYEEKQLFPCSGSRTGGRPLRKPLRQHFPARPYRLVFAINLESKKIKNQLLAADEERPVDQDKQQFVPGYLALFLWTHPGPFFQKRPRGRRTQFFLRAQLVNPGQSRPYASRYLSWKRTRHP